MEACIEKAKRVRLLILDIDGVLTSGTLYYGTENSELKGFHVQDGLGIKLLQRAGIPVAMISGKKSSLTIKRLTDLGIKHFYLGQEDKVPAFMELKQIFNLNDDEIAYMGDDLPDLPLLKRAGFAITVPNTPQIIPTYCDWVTSRQAGFGAVREVCDFILEAQGKLQSVIESYLKQ